VEDVPDKLAFPLDELGQRGRQRAQVADLPPTES